MIHDELSKEKPGWILSAYGPGKEAPIQLFGGYPREQSFEEVRLRHYELAMAGNQQQAIQEEQQLVANAEQQIQTALHDVNGAIRYIVSGEKEHPNRIDICKGKGASTSQAQPSTTLQPTNPFAQTPAFGQPSAPAPAFGQPSAFERPTTSFGQTPQLGKPINPFANPAPTFGQPTALALPPPPTFGQAPAFVQTSTVTPAFGQPANPTPFSQTAGLFDNTQAPVFGLPPKPAGFANQPIPAFGTVIQPQPTILPPNPFGGQPASQAGPFDALQAAPTSGFGRTDTHPLPAKPAPFSQPPSGPARSAPSSGTTRKDGSGRLTVWHGKPITYVDDEPCFKRPDGLWEKVWFPDATPSWTKEIEVPEGLWTDEVKEEYRYASENGAWKDGKMPDVMPKREWTNWDF